MGQAERQFVYLVRPKDLKDSAQTHFALEATRGSAPPQGNARGGAFMQYST